MSFLRSFLNNTERYSRFQYNRNLFSQHLLRYLLETYFPNITRYSGIWIYGTGRSLYLLNVQISLSPRLFRTILSPAYLPTYTDSLAYKILTAKNVVSAQVLRYLRLTAVIRDLHSYLLRYSSNVTKFKLAKY